jgi:conjugative transfer signal peptidase TraF
MTFAWKTLAAMSAASLSLALTAVSHPEPVLLWNTTASAPIGLFHLGHIGRPKLGELVAARPPEPLASWFDQAGYLPRGVPLVKHIAAVAGQRVCRSGDILAIDGRPVVRARARDRFGRQLPAWRGCYRLGAGDVLLLNAAVPDSLDGRYFGPSRASDLLGRVTPIWTRGGR